MERVEKGEITKDSLIVKCMEHAEQLGEEKGFTTRYSQA